MSRDIAALAAALNDVKIIADEAEHAMLINTLFEQARRDVIVVDFLNQHAGNLLTRNAQFRENFMASNIILRDGIGSKLALKAFERASGLNMNGTDFIPKLISAFAARRGITNSDEAAALIFFGTNEPWLSAGSKTLAGSYSGIMVACDGFAADADYLAELQLYTRYKKLIVLGMGMPRQEALAQYLKRADIGPALIVCGGAIIDFAAGRFARAPQWMQAVGLEWLFRLAHEPKRLFGRYVIGIPIFLTTVLRAVRRQKHTCRIIK